jgi:hypothetical protein
MKTSILLLGVLASALRLSAGGWSDDGYDRVADHGFLVRYAANLDKGESFVNIVNDGAQGASLSGPGIGKTTGQLCINVYTFSPDEQMVSCCSCPVTSNGVASLSVKKDLATNTLTGFSPTSVTIKLVATAAAANATIDCKYSAMQPLAPVCGMLAWGSTLHAQNVGASTGWATVETPFLAATLSAQESARLTNMCTNIYGNGSNYGICASCVPGALGAAKK